MWIDGVLRMVLPREDHFFDLLERGGEAARKSGELLARCCASESARERDAMVDQAIAIEHEADRVIVDVHEALDRTFVTPIDRSDIFTLASELEDVTDCASAALLQFRVHALHEVPKGSRELAQLIGEASVHIAFAVEHLRGLKRLDDVRTRCAAINQLERDGDRLFRSLLADLFEHERDAIRLLKTKELLEALESALDACDDVANALQSLVIKHA
jgi:hypothetical protein